MKGYKHAYNTTNESAVEAAAKASTEAQVAAAKKFKLWDLYDAIAKATDDDAKAKATKAFQAAQAKYLKAIARAIWSTAQKQSDVFDKPKSGRIQVATRIGQLKARKRLIIQW